MLINTLKNLNGTLLRVFWQWWWLSNLPNKVQPILLNKETEIQQPGSQLNGQQ
jgi:hypothetical protein